jgi:hypothetical protein
VSAQDALDAVWRGDPAVVVPSPPGAGKTRLVCAAAAMCVQHGGERVAVAAQTRAQALDIATRAATEHPNVPVVHLRASGSPFPNVLDGTPVTSIDKAGDIPDGPVVVVTTSARWQHVDTMNADLLIVDESWQLTSSGFGAIASIADRFLLVGDPGQISPVVTADISRWGTNPSGPHRPAPQALLATRPDVVTVARLDSTWRIGPDTTAVVQPAFYPDLPFASMRPTRSLDITAGRLAGVNSELVRIDVPGAAQGMADPAMAATVADIAASLVGSVVTDDTGVDRALDAGDVGVVCAHVVQTAAVAAQLAATHPGIRVDTTEAWQGLEREAMVVWHPFAGRNEVTDFARDTGRLCVMLSRHRALAAVVTRPGVDRLAGFAATALATVGDDHNPHAHQDVLAALTDA